MSLLKTQLFEKMDTATRNALSPLVAQTIYNTDTSELNYWDGAVWVALSAGGSGTVTSVSGTANRILITGTATDPIVDIDPFYIGQSSITTLGTIGTGVWQGSLVTGQYGGTGVNNNGKTITLGGNFATSGAFAATLTLTGVTNVTLPTSGTILAGTLTTTRIPYYNGTALTDSANLVWDNANNQLTLGSAGSATLPAISVGGTTNGMWLSGTNQLGFATNAVNRFNLDGTSFRSVTTGGPAIARAAGAVGTPTYSYQGNVNYGDWLNGTTIARSINGVQIHATNSTGFGIFNTAPTSALHINKNQNSVTQNDANGILLANSTAAIAGTQSISPAIVLQGNGWKTTATAGSQDVRFRMDVLPVQGSANPSATLQLASSINGGAYTNQMTVTSAGVFVFNGGGSINGTFTGATVGSFTSQMLAGTNNNTAQTFKLTNAGGTVTPIIMGFNSATAGLLAMAFDRTNGIVLTHGNGTTQIAGGTITLTNLTNTAGSEASDLSFYTQSGGTTPSEKLRLTSVGGIVVNSTQTATGTTGAQTINKPSGSVNFAAAATTLVVTNSLVTTSSNVFVQVEGTDITFTTARVTKAAGSFTITANAAATAETRVSFWVIN